MPFHVHVFVLTGFVGRIWTLVLKLLFSSHFDKWTRCTWLIKCHLPNCRQRASHAYRLELKMWFVFNSTEILYIYKWDAMHVYHWRNYPKEKSCSVACAKNVFFHMRERRLFPKLLVTLGIGALTDELTSCCTTTWTRINTSMSNANRLSLIVSFHPTWKTTYSVYHFHFIFIL